MEQKGPGGRCCLTTGPAFLFGFVVYCMQGMHGGVVVRLVRDLGGLYGVSGGNVLGKLK